MKGFFGIGVYHGKNAANLGMLYRSAYIFNANWIFTIGQRYVRPATDTVAAADQIPLYEYSDFEQMLSHKPANATLVAIEQGGKPLHLFTHPRRAIYLLGAEDHGIPVNIIDRCNCHAAITTPEANSLNLAVAGSIVLYSRFAQFTSNSTRWTPADAIAPQDI